MRVAEDVSNGASQVMHVSQSSADPNSSSSWCSYQGARKADDFLSFIDAKLAEDKGFARIESLDEFASKFSTGDVTSLVKDLTAKAFGLTDEAEKAAGEIYVKYGKKIVEKVRAALTGRCHAGMMK